MLTRRRTDTLKWIEALYRTFTDEDLDQHKSHLGIYRAPTLIPVSDFRAFIGGLPGVGLRISKVAETKFRSIRRAINATPAEWASLTTTDDRGKTRRLGDSAARAILKFVTES